MGVLIDDTGAELGCKEAWEVVVIDANIFFGEGSKHRMRSRRMGRRNMMYRGVSQWQWEVLD